MVVAEMQHITYNEWLPIVLGMKYMMKHSMEPTEQGFIDTYNPQVTALTGLNTPGPGQPQHHKHLLHCGLPLRPLPYCRGHRELQCFWHKGTFKGTFHPKIPSTD